MTDGIEKLTQDVAIMSAMAAEMDAYLMSDVLFWNMSVSNMPALTLGGYLMRQHRALILRDLLDEKAQAELDTAVHTFNSALVEKVVRFEQKNHRELEARLRQWAEYLRDVEQGIATHTSNYATAVESRAMISAIIDALDLPPYELEERANNQAALLDNQLRRRWEAGDFVWPAEWTPAYPKPEYWWLYGRPKVRRSG